MQFWNELEGQTIDGQFPLRRLVRSEGRSAWFETETPAPQAGRATISLTEALTDADEVIARLQAAQTLKHTNLVEITQVGQVSIDNTQVVYAVMEPIEQSLSDVLQSQSLSPEEGREVAEALVGALTAIHQNGMSHGHVEAASVLATEKTVKLRSDCLQTNTAGQAQDVLGIGGTLFHAFTQRKAANATDAQVNRIPAPFGEIVRNALARRWSLAQIANALRPAPPVPAAPPVAAASPLTPSMPVAAPSPARRVDPVPAKPAPENAAVKPAAQAAAIPVPPVTPAPAPAAAPAATTPQSFNAAAAVSAPVAASPTPPVRGAALPEASQATLFPEAYGPASRSAKSSRMIVYAALAVVVLAIIGWIFLRQPSGAPPVQPQSAATVPQTPAVAPGPLSAEKPAGKPSAATAGPHQRTPAATTSMAAAAGDTASRPGGRTIWRVVVYTYRGEAKAAESVAKLASEHPDLQPTVFKSRGSDSYMVILGGPMDRPHAKAMLAKARQEGLPQDTFVRNFSE